MRSYVDHDTQPIYPVYDEPAGINPWWFRLPILFVTGMVLLLAALGMALIFFQFSYLGKIVPGVRAYGVDLSGMDAVAAAQALEASFSYDDSAIFTFRDGDRFWQLNAGELGVRFDAQATATEALAYGHSGSFLTDVVDQTLIWLNGTSIAPIIRYDQAVALERLNQIAAEINRPAQEASLRITGTEVQAVSGQPGRTLNVMATLASLDNALTNLSPGGEIPLVISESAPVAWDSDTAAQRARVALSGPVSLTAPNPQGGQLGPWVMTVDQIAALLRVETVTGTDGSQSYQVDLDIEAFRPFLESMASGLVTPMQNGRYHFDEASGQLQVVQNAINGRRLNVDQTLMALEGAIFNAAQRSVEMVFDVALPDYNDSMTAADLGIRELISEGVTYYRGSTEARRTNILQAIARFDGIIIGPGEMFSFNEILGDISPEDGYVPGFIILGGRTVEGVGGGVCQVSSTVFRAAFYGGFPIQERWAHGYRVGFYENGDPEGVGMDAAIYTPDLDLRFINDLPSHLLIEAFVNEADQSVRFRLYGTNPGRTVVKDGPYMRDVVPPLPTIYEANPNLRPGEVFQVDYAVEGAFVDMYQVVLDANGNEIRRDRFASQYQPWAAVLQVAPGDSRLG